MKKIEVSLPRLNGSLRQIKVVSEDDLPKIKLGDSGSADIARVKTAMKAHPTGALNFSSGFHVRWK